MQKRIREHHHRATKGFGEEQLKQHIEPKMHGALIPERAVAAGGIILQLAGKTRERLGVQEHVHATCFENAAKLLAERGAREAWHYLSGKDIRDPVVNGYKERAKAVLLKLMDEERLGIEAAAKLAFGKRYHSILVLCESGFTENLIAARLEKYSGWRHFPFVTSDPESLQKSYDVVIVVGGKPEMLNAARMHATREIYLIGTADGPAQPPAPAQGELFQ